MADFVCFTVFQGHLSQIPCLEKIEYIPGIQSKVAHRTVILGIVENQ